MEKQNFETKDWVESSLLLANQLPLEAIKRRNQICFFQFRKTKKVIELIDSYWRGDLNVNLRSFVDAQRRIKDLIHRSAEAEGVSQY